jgi:hypothetical protein
MAIRAKKWYCVLITHNDQYCYGYCLGTSHALCRRENEFASIYKKCNKTLSSMLHQKQQKNYKQRFRAAPHFGRYLMLVTFPKKFPIHSDAVYVIPGLDDSVKSAK